MLTGLRVLCSLKLSSRKADCSFDNRSFFLVFRPFSSSSLALDDALSASASPPPPLLLPASGKFPFKPGFLYMLNSMWKGEPTLFADDTSSAAGVRFTSNPFAGGKPMFPDDPFSELPLKETGHIITYRENELEKIDLIILLRRKL